jgi:ribonucleoside-diphosphate reductase alpha chain
MQLPDFMVTTKDLKVEDHLVMQAACQEFIDASISKTINCPEDMSFEDFKHVYQRAYDLGLKGCTTYRPSGTRGSVLKEVKAEPEAPPVKQRVVKERPSVLFGPTYKVPDGHGGSMFMTVNIDPDTKEVFEVFLRDNTGNEYVEHAGRTLSLLLRAGVPVKEIRQQLKRSGGQQSIWYESRGFTSQLQLLDYVVFEQAAKFFLTMELAEGSGDDPAGFAGNELRAFG